MHGQQNIKEKPLPAFGDNMSVPSWSLNMGQVVPIRRYRITTIHCVTTQKSAVLICFAAEARN